MWEEGSYFPAAGFLLRPLFYNCLLINAVELGGHTSILLASFAKNDLAFFLPRVGNFDITFM